MAARHRLAATPGAIRHAILLTDGDNESETRGVPRGRASSACEGVFQCDCRGVGTDWQVAELRSIASRCSARSTSSPSPTTGRRLRGDDPRGRWASGRPTSACACGRRVARRSASSSRWRRRSRTSPAARVRVDERTVDYPTGAWGDEARDYHVHLDVPAQAVGDEMLAGRVSLVVDGEAVAQSLIRAVWTDDAARRPGSTRRSPTTPARPSWRRPSPTGSRRAPAATTHTATLSSVGPPSWPPRPATTARCGCSPASSTSTTPDRHGAAASRRRRRRRDGARHPLDADRPHTGRQRDVDGTVASGRVSRPVPTRFPPGHDSRPDVEACLTDGPHISLRAVHPERTRRSNLGDAGERSW